MSSYKHLVLFLTLGLMLPYPLSGQTVERRNIPVFDSEGRMLINALSGGLNSPQFSTVHLNGDSLADLFVFDRSGSKVLTFVADPESPSRYRHQPEYETSFPELQEWALLRDFNGDSIPDIFSFSTTGVPGIDVYVARIEQGVLHFDKLSFNNPVGVLGYPTSSGSITNIYVSSTDIPAIDDLDGDGDLDILTFQSDGTKLYYYRNRSVDNGYGLDTFDFVLEDRCWGRIVESFNTNEVILSDDSTQCPVFNQHARLHSGSTVTTFDRDQDGDKDLLLGDITYETILYLENGGSSKSGWITAQTTLFPNVDDPIAIPYFPAVYILDIDHDGIPDIVASPNEKDSRENVNLSWFYSGQEDGGFSLVGKSFLNEEMLDFGTEAHPLFLDYNGDGLLDLVVGSRFHEGYQNTQPSQLFLFENTGSTGSPEYTLVDEDWLNLGSMTTEADALFPTSVDIDGDGDYDLVIGNKFGKLFLIENVGIENGPFEMGTVTYPWFDIDVGFSSTPAFTDIDGDGVLDMLVGEERGNINFFRNMGSRLSPVFLNDPQASENHEEFGGIDARQNIAVFGMSAPYVFQNQDTALLLVGTAFGNMLLYDISDVDPSDILVPWSSHPVAGIREGARSKPTLADIDSDGYLDLMIGTSRGGINLYRTNFQSRQMVPVTEFANRDLIDIYPNPAEAMLYLRSSDIFQNVWLFHSTGAIMRTWQGSNTQITIPVGDLKPGVYLAAVRTRQGLVVKTWIKM